MKKIMTLAFILEENRILLSMKKSGFGGGRYNGYGGKVKPGESLEEALVREMQEESGVRVDKSEKVGIHEFRNTALPDETLEVHVFKVLEYTGEPVETLEMMRPEWFTLDAIPFENMWPDDIHWFPYFLDDKKFRTRFLFGENDIVLEKDIQIVEQL